MIGMFVAALLYGSACMARADTLGTIMPVGDSITNGDGSYNLLGFRDDLASLLSDLGIAFSYVGDVLGEAEDPRYPGHFLPGAVIEQFYPPDFGNGWGTGSFDIGPALQDLHPDVVLIHLGTNNVASQSETPLGPYSYDSGQTLNRSVAGYAAELIAYIAAHYQGYPEGTPLIVLCQIIPIMGKAPEVMAFNDYLEEMAIDMAGGQVTGEPVHIVLCDQFWDFIENPWLFSGLPGDYMNDGLHPNDAGYGVMAQSYLAALLDETPPAAVTDLTVWGQGPHSVRVWWTAPGDDYWSGTPSMVTFRFWDQPITDEQQFAGAWELAPGVVPNPPGTVQQLTVGGLPGGMTYWLALTVTDDAGNVSPVSNSLSVTIAAPDSLVEEFNETPATGVWDLGDDYYVDGGMLRSASPLPAWSPPAICVGELQPWGGELELPSGIPASETGRIGLVVLSQPSQTTDGFALICSGDRLELRLIDAGMLGAVVDTATSRFGALMPGSRLAAFPFVFEGSILVRTTRDGVPDRILSTGIAAQALPSPSCAGIIMQGALGWGIERFRLEGPGLWQRPGPFHLVAPDSAAQTTAPPVLVWSVAPDGDPWDHVAYSVLWSTVPNFTPDLAHVIPCGPDTAVPFPPGDYATGQTYYWKVRAEDGTGLERFSIEDGWYFVGATGAEGHPTSVRIHEPAPNPCSGVLRVACEAPTALPVRLHLFDLGGRRVAHSARAVAAGAHEITWVLPREVPPGAYVLTVIIGTSEERFPISLRR